MFYRMNFLANLTDVSMQTQAVKNTYDHEFSRRLGWRCKLTRALIGVWIEKKKAEPLDTSILIIQGMWRNVARETK